MGDENLSTLILPGMIRVADEGPGSLLKFPHLFEMFCRRDPGTFDGRRDDIFLPPRGGRQEADSFGESFIRGRFFSVELR